MRVSPLWIFPHSPWYRLSVAAVRDCGLLSCQNTPKFERGRMLDLPLKPLLLLHFVTNWPSFLSSDTPFCLSTISIISFCLSDSVSAKFYFLSGIFLVFSGGQSKLFCKLWFAGWLWAVCKCACFASGFILVKLSCDLWNIKFAVNVLDFDFSIQNIEEEIANTVEGQNSGLSVFSSTHIVSFQQL